MILGVTILINEVWKDVTLDKFKPYYQVSNTGNVRNKITGRFLKHIPDSRGYLKVALTLNLPYKKNTTVGIHRLVAYTFIPNDDPLNKTTVNHIDYDKTNNCVDNLEWMSVSDNVKDSYITKHHKPGAGVNANSSKYSETDIRRVCELLEIGESPKNISIQTGVPKNIIGHIKAKNIWTSISKEYNIKKPNKRNKFDYLYSDIDRLIDVGLSWKEIRKTLRLPKSKPIRDLIVFRIKKSRSSTTIENKPLVIKLGGF